MTAGRRPSLHERIRTTTASDVGIPHCHHRYRARISLCYRPVNNDAVAVATHKH